MKKEFIYLILLLGFVSFASALPTTYNPFTTKLDFYGIDSNVANTCTSGEISSWNGTKFICVVGGNVTGMASWTVSNKTSSTAISDSEILNFTGGNGIRVGLLNNEITITSTVVDTDTDTNDSARVNSLNSSLLIQTARIDDVNSSVNAFQPSAYTNISALQSKPDETGSWINSTTRTSTHLNVTVGGQLLVNNSAGQGYSEVRGTSAKFVLNETDYELSSWSFLVSFADFFFKQETASNRSFNVRGFDNKDRLRVNLANNVTTINDTLQVTNLTAASCDVKADTNGFIYCGTDATGGGGAVNNGILLDAQYNLTNKIGLQNSTLLACQNITGSTSNLCTIVDTDTDTNDSARVNNINASLLIQTARIDSLNTSLLAINTSSNIAGLGFYTSTQTNTIANNLQSNITAVNSTVTAQTTQINNLYANITSINSSVNARINELNTTKANVSHTHLVADLTDKGNLANTHTLDAGFNLTNVNSGLQNKTTLSCSNITGAVSDLCTITGGSGSGDGTGGWINTTTQTKTLLEVNITNNSIYLGTGADDSTNKNIYFKEDGSDVGESIFWQDAADQFEITDGLFVWADVKAGTDMYTTAAGGDIWTGTSTQSASNFSVTGSTGDTTIKGLTNVTNTIIVRNISFQNTSDAVLNGLYMNPTGNAINVIGQLYANTILSSGAALYTDGDLYTRGSGGDIWLGASSQSNANVSLTPSSIQLRGSAGGINTTYLTVQNLNSGASCDLKAYTNGTIYCGTDSGGSATDYSILSDAQYNLTNKIGLQNSTLLACQNITGAVSDLCTITGGGGSGDGTGGWTNTTINTSTGLTVYMNDSFNYLSPNRDMNTLFCDFTSSTYVVGACAPDFYGTVAGTGGISAIDTAPLGTRGVFSISRGTAANSGYTWGTHLSAIRISGGEEFSTLMNFTLPTGTNETRGILGFCDAAIATSGITLCTRGVWFNLTGNLTNGLNVSGMTNNAGTPTNSKTGFYRISPNQLYIFKIIILNQSRANFSIYHPLNNTYLWSEEVNNANFPNNTTAAVGARVNVGETLAGTAGVRATIDYILVRFKQTNNAQFNRFR